ncbi:23S rRNA (pseudouridine(1915)-N(3))-methyltransferase RlmH [Marinagarivorans algicola]|uniref:23S rRNA (pseudouridine(1915)-N(3))-methyltransferase RlmH n=1 Tax=Marinagarivorans algicola TaxID=1513270 RepID=UPI0006B42F6F|nr:23S rRNA (pseudouridine(1915)-N(3))-methyltransferase RlmH [Marinagarivorans algicola]
MKVQLIAVGTKMPDWIQKGYGEYCKRLPKELAPKLIELAPGHRGKNASVSTAIETEGKEILNAIASNDFVIALEVLGKPWATEQLAGHLTDWRMEGQNLCFIIGGPDGLSASVLARANAKWSMSNLTLPHPLVRVVFIEQLYRAWTILNNHPYHK